MATYGASLHTISEACIREWNSKQSDLPERVVLKASIMEGRRKEGISKQLFDYMFHVVSSMKCWDPEQVQEAWKESVSYEIQPGHLEKDLETLTRTKDHLSSKIMCNFKGDEATLLLAYEEKDVPAVHLGVDKYANVTISMEKESSTKNYLQPDMSFHKIVVEVQKTLTYKEHFDWDYTFLLRYREPYYDTNDIMRDVLEKDLVFCDPPMCYVVITCTGVKEVTDSKYLADSLLCKIRDLLPPDWKAALTLDSRA